MSPNNSMISIVIPVYNNAATLEPLTERLDRVLQGRDYEIIYVNDGSTDGSLDLLRSLARRYPRVRAIALARNFGQHPAISAGFEHARGERIILMDADLEDRPEHIPLLLEKLDERADIVFTIKQEENSRLTSYLYHSCFSRLVNISVPRNIGTFRVFNRKVLEAMLKFREVNILYGPLMFYIGFHYTFVTVERDTKPLSGSSYTFSKRLFLALNSLMTYTDLPHKAFSYLGFFLLMASIAYGLLIIVQYFLFGRGLPDGLTLILVYLSFLTGAIMFSMGILGAYLFRVFQEVLRRPRYLIDEIIESRMKD